MFPENHLLKESGKCEFGQNSIHEKKFAQNSLTSVEFVLLPKCRKDNGTKNINSAISIFYSCF